MVDTRERRSSIALLRSTDFHGDSRVERVACTLAESGLQVTIYRWAREGFSGSMPLGVRVATCSRRAHYGRGWRNILGMAAWQGWLVRELFRRRPSVVYACDLDTAIAAAAYSAVRRSPWAFDQFDPYEGRMRSSPARRLLRRIEATVASRASIRVVPTGHRRYGPFADAVIVGNAPRTVPVHSGRSGGPTLFYGGVLQPDRGLDTALAAVLSRPNWRLVVAGFGPLEPWLHAQANKHPQITVLGPLAHADLLYEMSAATLALGLYDPSVAANQQTASNKLLEAAAVGVPLLAAAGTAVAEAIERHDLGFVADMKEPSSVARCMDAAAALTDEDRVDLSRRGHMLLETEGWPVQRQRLVDAVAGLVT